MISSSYSSGFKQSGFSLFELIVFVLSVAIIYSYAAQRFNGYPGEAEKANFITVRSQLQNSITLYTFTAQLNGGRDALIATLEGGNPMSLMLRPPRNYLGEFERYTLNDLPRRSWFFDMNTSELVYLIGSGEGVIKFEDGRAVPAHEIRLHIKAEYGLVEKSTGLPIDMVTQAGRNVETAAIERKFLGLVLTESVSYAWGTAVEKDDSELFAMGAAQ